MSEAWAEPEDRRGAGDDGPKYIHGGCVTFLGGATRAL
jgi:hypothetical protein